MMQIYVFDRNLNFTGAIDNYSSLRWRRRFNQFSEFELHCPLNTDTLSLLIRGSIICKSDTTEEAGFIEYRELQQNEQGEEFLVIKGKFLKSYLDRRIIWLQELLNCTHEVAMRTLVKDQCITPTLTDRVMPNLQLGTLKNYVGNINYQVTYNNLFDELINLTNLSNLGFRILLDTINKKLNFDVYQGLDRTAGQAINPRCIFSADFDNILSQNYIDSSNNLKNVALVAGVGVGPARKLVTVGSSAGLDRFEMFVDANNLSNINSVDSSVIADATYLPMLTAKGTADLALTADIKTFDSKVNTNSNLVYKTDYDLGDKVTCLNKKWGLTMDTVIVEIEEIYEAQGTKINVVFGNNIPTLADKIKIIQGASSSGGTDNIVAGTTAQYYRGDKAWATLDKTAVGLANVNNTSDALKPISTATQTALNLKAPSANPTFTGAVVLPATTAIGLLSSAEIAFLATVTSNIQTQLNAINTALGLKSPLASPSFTGVVSASGGYSGLGRRIAFTWTGTIPVDGSVTITHNLGYKPLVNFNGTGGNVIYTYDHIDNNNIRMRNYSTGGNNFTGSIYFY